ncbi:MAG: class I lanthipeptide [Hyphomicrobiales bacterium]
MKKLQLRKETVASLDNVDLNNVVGGNCESIPPRCYIDKVTFVCEKTFMC